MKRAIKNLLAQFGYGVYPRGTIPMDVRRMSALTGLSEVYKRIAAIPGSIVECGVGKGRTFLIFSYFIEQEGKRRALWGFDSFQGFPDPSPEDASSRNPKKGEWSGTSAQDIKRILQIAGISASCINDSVHLVPGFFEASLSKYDSSPIALLHIDADLYESYRTVLRTLEPLLVPGGILLFDEYGEERWPGATKAVDEYLKESGRTLERTSSGKYYVQK